MKTKTNVNNSDKHINFDTLISSEDCTISAFNISTAQRSEKEKQWLYYFLMHKEAVFEILTGEEECFEVHMSWIIDKMPSFSKALYSDDFIAASYINIANKILQRLYIQGHTPQEHVFISFSDNKDMARIAEDVHANEINQGDCIKEVLSIFKKWLYIEHDTDITIPFAYILSNFTNTDPGCMAIVAPSGSYKTEFIRSLGETENNFIFPIDNLTQHTLISGLQKAEDVIPQLNRRLITIKDFTALLSKRDDERTAIFSDIREMLDGYMNRSFGSGKRVNYTDIHSSLLIASTNAIERYYSLNATLGQRMIFFRPSNNPTEARKRALKNMSNVHEMREELGNAVHNALSFFISKKASSLAHIGDALSEDKKETIGKYVDFVAIVRTHITRDYKGYISEIPEPEFPTRLYKEIIKVIECHAILYERCVTEIDIKAGLIVLMNNIPQDRLKILKKLIEEPDEGYCTTDIAISLSLSTYMTKQRLNELLMLKLVTREKKGGNMGDTWCIRYEYSPIIDNFLSYNTEFVLGGKPPGSTY